jgi:hypothetical protein
LKELLLIFGKKVVSLAQDLNQYTMLQLMETKTKRLYFVRLIVVESETRLKQMLLDQFQHSYSLTIKKKFKKSSVRMKLSLELI